MGNEKETLELRYTTADKIIRNELNPRKDLGDLSGMIASIREYGIIEPLIVRQYQNNGKLELVAGERRWSAIKEGIKQKVLPKDFQIPYLKQDVDNETANKIMIVENLHRKDLTDYERAEAFNNYISADNPEKDIKSLACETGFTPQYVRRQIRVMGLDPSILKYWKDGKLTFAHMEQFLRIDSEDAITLAENAAKSSWNCAYLKHFIEQRKAILSDALFDKKATGCTKCGFSTMVQKSLFGGEDMKADQVLCMKPSCFFEHQTNFIKVNFKETGEAIQFGTVNPFFCEEPYKIETRIYNEVNEKCFACEHFCTAFYSNGTRSIPRCCANPDRTCYDNTYPKNVSSSLPGTTTAEDKKTKKTENLAADSAEAFFANRIPSAFMDLPDDDVIVFRAALSAIIQSVHINIIAKFFDLEKDNFGVYGKRIEYQKGIADMSKEEVLWALKDLSLLTLMEKYATSANIRYAFANQVDAKLDRDFVMTEDYLKRKTKDDLIAMNEKWHIFDLSPEVMRSMKKSDLVKHFLTGKLTGLIPDEIIAYCEGKNTEQITTEDPEDQEDD